MAPRSACGEPLLQQEAHFLRVLLQHMLSPAVLLAVAQAYVEPRQPETHGRRREESRQRRPLARRQRADALVAGDEHRAARGIRTVDGARGPRFNQSSLVIEAAANGRGIALAKRTLAQADLDSGRLVIPFEAATAVDFAYYVVHPKAKGRLPQVKAFVNWLKAEAEAHEAALQTMDNGSGI